MNTNEKKQPDLYFLVCFLFSLAGLVFFFLYRVFHINPLAILPGKCVILSAFHIPCPGCGGTRSLLSLMNGQWIQSFLYHPAPLLLLIWDFLILFTHALEYISRQRIHGIVFHFWHIYTFIGIVLLQWIIKLFLI